jgi:fungal STAND N-terminal Goodbye domain
MADPSQSSRLRVLFESALEDYQNQTGMTLTHHPIAQQLRTCDSVESVIAVLKAQARAFRKSREGDGPIMKSLERVVSVLYTLSASTGLGEAIVLVRRQALMGTLCL